MMIMARRPQNPLFLRLIFAVPIIGWMLEDAMDGKPDAPFWFLFNFVAITAISVLLWGYAALIAVFLGATALMLLILMILTRGE